MKEKVRRALIGMTDQRHERASSSAVRAAIRGPLVNTSAAKVSADLRSLIGRELPAGVGDALPSLVAKPLANGPVADAEPKVSDSQGCYLRP